MIYFIENCEKLRISMNSNNVEIVFVDENGIQRTGYAVKNSDGTFDLSKVEVE